MSVNETNVPVNGSIVELQTPDLTNVSNYAAKTDELVEEENLTEEFESMNDANDGLIPIATSSSISYLSTDAKQKLLAFNSEFGDDNIEQMEEDPSDRLEFLSSDSMHDSNDLGVNGSCANTSSINVSSGANQTGITSIKSEDVSISEIEVARTPAKENSIESQAAENAEKTNIEAVQTSDNISTVGQVGKIECVEVVSTLMEETETVNENTDKIATFSYPEINMNIYTSNCNGRCVISFFHNETISGNTKLFIVDINQ